MSNQLDSILGRALSIRLNMQISLSSLAIVEEWMDEHLERWMDSIPLPPEMPRGHTAHFGVTVAADLSDMSWRSYGDPAGFIPKMAKYFEDVKMTSEDIGILDMMGNSLEPELVGTWIRVAAGTTTTGWQFCDEHSFAALISFFADHQAKQTLQAWAQEAGIERFRRFAQSVGEHVYSEIEMPVNGRSVGEKLDAAAAAFQALAGQPFPEYLRRALSTLDTPEICVGVRVERGAITRISVISPGVGHDVIDRLAQDAGLGFDNKLTKLEAALRADGADQLEFTLVLDDDTARPQISVHFLPSDAERSTSAGMN